MVAGDYGHLCALLDDGTVNCFGYDGSGALGLGDTQSRNDGPSEMGDALPYVALGDNARAQRIAVGVSHACALLDSGAVKCWGGGRNNDGQAKPHCPGDEPGEMADDLLSIDLW